MIIDRTKESFNNGYFDCYLSDDGTIDTVIEINKHAEHKEKYFLLREYVRIDSHAALEYRDSDGSISEDSFKELCIDHLNMFENRHTEIIDEHGYNLL